MELERDTILVVFGLLLICVGMLGLIVPQLLSVLPAWVKPDGFSDPDNAWVDEPSAYDENTLSRAYCEVNPYSYSGFLILTVPSTVSDKLRFYLDYGGYGENWIDVDVYKDDVWVDVFEGFYLGTSWVEKTFSQGTVTQVRLRHENTLSIINGVYVNEVSVWQVLVEPPETQPQNRWALPMIVVGFALTICGVLVPSKRKPS